jgi:hypothetical protein
MKFERIEELLVGTPYADRTSTDRTDVDVEARCITTWREIAGEKAVMDDRYLNAARVQLLAKALQFYTGDLADELGDSYVLDDRGATAREALTEAGLNEQKEG